MLSSNTFQEVAAVLEEEDLPLVPKPTNPTFMLIAAFIIGVIGLYLMMPVKNNDVPANEARVLGPSYTMVAGDFALN